MEPKSTQTDDANSKPPAQKRFMTATEAAKNAKVLRKARERVDVTVEMLLSPEGLTQLAENFERTHANMNYGKDTEFHNLKLMLRDYEAWAARLCPGLEVDVFVERCEKLSGHSLIRETLDNANGRVPKKKKSADETGSVRKRKKNKTNDEPEQAPETIETMEPEELPEEKEEKIEAASEGDGLVLNLPTDMLELSVGDDDEDDL